MVDYTHKKLTLGYTKINDNDDIYCGIDINYRIL